jgi:hypothetical protein
MFAIAMIPFLAEIDRFLNDSGLKLWRFRSEISRGYSRISQHRSPAQTCVPARIAARSSARLFGYDSELKETEEMARKSQGVTLHIRIN